MSLSVKIVDNTNGEVLVDRNDVDCVLGSLGDSEKTQIVSFMRCTGMALAEAVYGLLRVIEETYTDAPETRATVEMLSLMRRLASDTGDSTHGVD